MILERDKLYKDRGGTVWRVVCVDLEGEYPVVAVDNFTNIELFAVNGGHSDRRDWDLLEEYTPPAKPRDWVVSVNKQGHITGDAVTGFDGSEPVEWVNVREVVEKHMPAREWWFNPRGRDYFLVTPKNSSLETRPLGFIRVREVVDEPLG